MSKRPEIDATGIGLEPLPGAGGEPAPAGGAGSAVGERPRLARPPGDRLLPATPAGAVAAVGAAAPARTLLIGGGVGAIGAVALCVLLQFNLGPGLFAISAFTGWLVAVALVEGIGTAGLPAGGRRLGAALGLAVGAVLLAMLMDWGWSRVTGGVLGPIEYWAARYGVAALLNLLVAAALAGLRAR